MANITAKDVADLRAKTGIGMMECKKALVEAEGDKAAIVEVNTETDFVAKNEMFKTFVKNLLKSIIANNPADIEALMASDYEGVTVEAKLKELIFQIGEKITVRRFAVVEGVTSTYIHGLGSIGVIVKFDTDCADKDGFADFAKNIALQVGAYPTPYLDRNAVPAEIVENEKNIIKAQLANDPKMAGKPEKVLDGIVMGKIGKFYESNCLVDMEYVKAEDHETVAKYVANTAKAMGGKIAIASFVRFEKGEGIEKKQEDYAAEIAKLSGVKQ